MKKLLLALIPLLMLSGCTQEVSRTTRGWCVAEAQEAFAFDFEGENGIVFVQEVYDYFINDEETPENPNQYVYLIDIVHDGNPNMVIAEYIAWVELKETRFDNAAGRKYFPESYIIDIGCELIERL